MKKINCRWNGIKTLIMHSCRGVNPLDPLARELAELNKKRNKTEDDLIKISDLEWEIGLYWDNEIGLYIPGENVSKCVREGAMAKRKGKDIERGFYISEAKIPLDIGEMLTKERMKTDYRFRDVRAMSIKKSKVSRTRPRFDKWSISFNAEFDESILNLSVIENAMDYAGRYIGLGDSRTRGYGKFASTIELIG